MMICISTFSTAQETFQKTFGSPNDDGGNFVQQTSDKGYILAGYATNFIAGANSDAYIIKTNSDGIIQWNKTYGGTFEEVANCVQQTSDGGYIIAGRYHLGGSGSGYRGFLIKTNSNGDTTWAKTYGSNNSNFISVRQTVDGGYIAAGYHQITSTSDAAYLTKIDALGYVIWTKKYGGTTTAQTCYLNSVQQTIDGGYIACGGTEAPAQSFLLKVNSAGDTLWNKTYNSYYKESRVVQQTTDGGYILGGYYSDGSGGTGGYIIKTDGNGNITWNKLYGTSGLQYIQQISNGNYIAILPDVSSGQSVCILKLNSIGNNLWSKKYQPSGNVFTGNYIRQTDDGGFVIMGTSNINGTNDYYLTKTDSNGLSNCNEVTLLMSPTSPSISSSNLHYPIALGSSTPSNVSIYVYSQTPYETTLCTTVGIQQFSNNTDAISIYPNPATNNITIESPQQAVIEILNIQGQLIKTYTSSENKTNVNVSMLPSGVYVVKVKTEKGITVMKFIKE